MGETSKKGIRGIAVTVALTLLGGVGGWFGSVFTYKGTLAQSSSSLEAKYLEAFTKELENLRASAVARSEELRSLYMTNKELREKNEELLDELEKLRTTQMPGDTPALLEALINAMPYPAWLHEVGNNNWFINDAYSKKWHVTRKDFWTPINIFERYPKDAAAVYVANDMRVVASGVARVFREDISEYVLLPEGPNNPTDEWSILKVPISVGNKQYVFGAAFRTNDPTAPSSIFDGYPDAVKEPEP